MLKVGEAFKTSILVTDASGLPATGKTISYTIYDETHTVFATGSLTEIEVDEEGTGVYYVSWTPDAVGYWIVEFYYNNEFRFYDARLYQVGSGLEADILADTNELQADFHDGGRLDLLIDGIKSKTDLIVSGGATEANVDAVESKIDTIDGIVDEIKIQTDKIGNETYGLAALNTDLDTLISNLGTVDTVVDAIKVKTDNIGASVALETGGNLATVLADTNELQTDWANGGRLDLLLDAVKAKTDLLFSGIATEAKQDTIDSVVDAIKAKTDLIGASVAPASEYDTEMARITGNVALEATLTAIKGSGWTTETLKAIYDSIDGLNDITAASVWSVGTRSLTDKANFSLSTTGIDAIRKSVCLTGDTASSIGKILFDLNARLTSTRAGYLDNLSGGAVALNSTVAKEATLTHTTYGLDKIKTETASLVSKVDVIDGIVDLIKVETDKISNATYGLSAIKTAVNAIPTTAMRGTDNAALASVWTSTRGGYIDYLANGTYGLAAIQTEIAVVDSVVDNIQEDTDKIDVLESLINSVMDLYRVGGTVTTDGTEQIIYISDNPSGLIKPMRFLIDTTNHTSDETVVLKFYYRVKNGGSYVVFSSATLSGVQSPLGVSYDLLPNAWGYKVTIEKTAGTNRDYDWEIFGGE